MPIYKNYLDEEFGSPDGLLGAVEAKVPLGLKPIKRKSYQKPPIYDRPILGGKCL